MFVDQNAINLYVNHDKKYILRCVNTSKTNVFWHLIRQRLEILLPFNQKTFELEIKAAVTLTTSEVGFNIVTPIIVKNISFISKFSQFNENRLCSRDK